MIKEFNFNAGDTTYLTHSLHPYPAKFPPQLPKMILQHFSKAGETVLDPFCGSGTTLVEARLQKMNVIGVDVNALSCLLSKVKATPLTQEEIKKIHQFVNQLNTHLNKWKSGDRPKITIKEIEGLRHWFQLNVATEITFILEQIHNLKDVAIKDFLKIVLSSIIVRVSNQDSDTRYAAINKNILDYYTIELFIERVNEYLCRIAEFSQLVNGSSYLSVYNADSRDLSFIISNTIDIIITSPPYANTYDYYLYHKFRKRWLDMDVNFAQYHEIGSRREYSSLKKSHHKWTSDLIQCFREMQRVLKKDGLAFIIIGDSVINKQLIHIDHVISDFSHSVGLKICEIVSSDLASHSRIFNPMFAQQGKKEHHIVLQKL